MNDNDNDLTVSLAIKAILIAAAPDGLPEEVSIRAMGDTEPVERPYLVAFCENGASPHPRLRQTELVLRLLTRADEQDALTAAGWHQAAAGYLIENPASLHATLEPLGLAVKVFRAAEYSDTEEDGRARQYDQRWKVWLETEV